MKSIQLKNETLEKQKQPEIDPNSLPREVFTDKQFIDVWDMYIQQLSDSGKKIQASNLGMSRPTVKNDVEIHFEVPNQIVKTEILREENQLLEFLRKALNNYDISLQIIENEAVFKQKYAFTPRERYEKLLEANPLLEAFRQKFNLEF